MKIDHLDTGNLIIRFNLKLPKIIFGVNTGERVEVYEPCGRSAGPTC